jgi:hypothetical protein
MDDAVALAYKAVNELVGPRNHLRTKAHDEQDHRRVGWAVFLITYIDIVGADIWHDILPYPPF